MKEREEQGEEGGNGVKHKERSFEKAPGLSRGRGRAASTTLPSVQQTDGEREREAEREGGREGERSREGGVKVGGGWERERGSSNSAHRSNERSRSLSEVELRGRWEHIHSVHHKARF